MSRLLLTSLRWLSVALVFLTAAEVFARLDDKITWGAPFLGPYTNERLLNQDSVGFRGRPNFRYQKWRMNNLGFRGPDITSSPAPGVRRIAVIGASETFGLFESDGAEYPARMQVILDSIAPGRYEVINVALPGLSIASMVPYIQRAVVQTGASILVIYPTPSFYLEVQPLSLEYLPPRYQPPPLLHFARWTMERAALSSRLVAKGREVLKQLVPPVVVTKVRESRLAARRAAHDSGWVWRTVPADRMETFRTQLNRLVASARKDGLQPLLVTHANRFSGAMRDTAGPDRRHIVNPMSLYYPQAPPSILIGTDSVANAIMCEVGAAQGVPVVEAEREIPASPAYFADFVHFTDVGADKMAHLVVRGILSHAANPPPLAQAANHR